MLCLWLTRSYNVFRRGVILSIICKEYFIEQNIVILKYSYIHDNVDRCWNNVGIVYHAGGKYDKFQVTKYRKDLNCYTYIVWQSMIFFVLTPLHWQSSKSRKHRSSIKRKANLSPLWRAIFCPLFFISVNHE